MSLWRWLRFGAILVAASGGACVLRAQIPVGTLSGIVTDPKDAVVTGAHVTAVSASQGASRTTDTNGSGIYVLSDLPAGAYDLRIEHAGFAAAEFKGTVLQAGNTATIAAPVSQVAAIAAMAPVAFMPPVRRWFPPNAASSTNPPRRRPPGKLPA